MLRTGHLLTISSLTTSGLGVLFWVIATRNYGTATVGTAYSAVAAMTLLAAVGQLNLDAVMTRFVPAAGPHVRRLVALAYAAAFAVALAAAAAFVLLVPMLSRGLSFLHAPALGAAFVLGTAAYALFVVQDGVLTGLRRPGWVVVENAAFALAKIILVVVLTRTALRGQGILMSWIIALVVCVAVTNIVLYPRLRGTVRGPRDARTLSDRSGLPGVRYIAGTYIGQMFWMAAGTLPPIMVLDQLDATRSGYYSLAWLIANTLFLISINMGLSLMVEVARNPDRIDGFRRMLRHSARLVAAGAAVLIVGAPYLLRIFGVQYSHNAVGLLRVLALSALPAVIIMAAVSVACVEQRMSRVVVIYGMVSALVLGLTAVLLPIMGLIGAGVAWVAATTLTAAALLLRRDLWYPGRRSNRSPAPADAAAVSASDGGAPASAAAPGRQELGEPAPEPEPEREPEAAVESGPPAPAPPVPQTLTVIVCAFTTDRWDDVRAAIDSLSRQTHRPEQVLLVIDHCPPLFERARGEFAGVQVLRSTGEKGLSGARNTGVRAATGDVVAFLDDDAVADREWAERLLAPYADPDIIGVGGCAQPSWDEPRPRWFPREFDWVVGCSYRGLPRIPAQVRNFIGANMSFRRDVLMRLDGFRPDLGRIGTRPLGGEETELCIRAADAFGGSLLLYDPSAVVHHRVRAERGRWRYFRARCYAEGLSKAAVSRHAGAGQALASERTYLRRTIPSAFLRPLRRGAGHQGWATLPALVIGVLWTVAGYLRERADGPLRTGKAAALPAETETIRTFDRVAKTVALAALPAALGLWLYSLTRFRLAGISDLGLVTALPVPYWAALALLTAGFAATIVGRARTSVALPVGYVLVLIAVLHATPALVYPHLRYAWAWKHVSIVDVLLSRHSVPNVPDSSSMAAYSQWPGFFTLNTLLVHMTGASSAEAYAAWGPPLFNTLMIVPLILLYRSITGWRRLLWCGVWIYFISSWVGQDYFSPQAYSFVLYVLFLAVVVRRIGKPSAAVPGAADDAPGPVRARPAPSARFPRAELGLLLLIAAAIDSSHQLTPIMLVTVLAALMIQRRYRGALLPLFCGVALLTVAWNATVGRPFIAAHLSSLIKAIGSLDANTGTAFTSLSSISGDQTFIGWVDRVLTAGIGVLGVIALLRRPRLRSPLGWLALSPLVLVGMSDYGGEITFRMYLFALPAFALLVAALLLPAQAGRASLRPAAARAGALARPALVCTAFVTLLSGLIFAYYGKEAANYFTDDEIAASEYVWTHAKPGEVVIAVNGDYPAAYTNYPDHNVVFFGVQNPGLVKQVTADPVEQVATLATVSPDLVGYIILTRSQEIQARQTGALPPGAFDQIRGALDASPATPVVFQNADASVYRIDLQSIATPHRHGPS